MKRVAVIPLLLLISSLTLCAEEEDAELEALKSQAKELSQRIDAYEKKNSSDETSLVKDEKKEAGRGYIVDDAQGYNAPMDQKGVLELTGANSVLSVGGRIELHSIYAWPEGAYFAGQIPLDDTGENGQLIMSARDSRLWVKTRTPTEYGPIRTLIEVDFLGTTATEINTNSHGLRLRHAYLEAAGFTVGQTNSAFNAFVTLDTITYPVNDTLVRQPLIRYSINNRSLGYDISFEQPETTLLDQNGTIITPKDDVAPDIVARLRYYPLWGETSVALLGRYITQDQVTLSDGSRVTSRDAAFGWGVNMSGKIKLYGLDDIRYDLQYGVGLGRYVAFNAFAAGSIDADGNIQLQPAYGGHIGYRHWWSQKLRSTLALSYAGTDNHMENVNIDDSNRVTKDVYGLQLNLLWIPVPNGLVGLEYSKALRSVESGEEGNMDMVTLLVRYDF
ncbi:MAG: DcaP family trimeric outer membrane transporter [Sulfurimonadaceae bacterium]